uniref:Uncharacterized protein n=1 Tax=viral metagenome TaxID=1070528 RepID=A0A6M3KYS6_9ZZZZ
MQIERINKTHLSKTEAYEISQEHGIEELPAIGYETLIVPAIASKRVTQALGKDKSGYYIETLII